MVFIITRLKYEAMNQLIGKIEVICERNFEIKNCINENQSEQFSHLILDIIQSFRQIFNKFIYGDKSCFNELRDLVDYQLINLDQLNFKIKQILKIQTSKSKGVTFEFIEAQLLDAIKKGYWILLDNVNSAPPEIIERLNSLTEENPVLNVVEYSDGEMLTRNKGIH